MYSFYQALKANKNVGLEDLEGNEPTLYERLAHVPQLEKVFQDAMQAISVQANGMLLHFVDFSDVCHVVDVGGGDGTNAIALARRYPHLHATVFDSPSVCQIAQNNVQRAGLDHQVATFSGDCFEDPFPANADCFLFSHFATIWSEERNRHLLRKTFQALPSGGKVVVFNMMQHDDETGPLSAAMGSPYFLTLATGEGMLYTWSEYQRWMKEAGFSEVQTRRLPRDHGAVIGTKP
jgi:cyclopropane fatty-acyl-phospholipid synthase-like methyltransferase